MTSGLNADSLAADDASAPRSRVVVEVLLVFAVFSLHGAWPVPDVNEPHYLSKAKHYWDSSWCANDFFVNTTDAHQVFYWTFGWLTRYLSLDQVAWLGRLLTWGLLAWAWRRLSWTVLPRAWWAVLAAELFVMLNENAHMAGEWVIGGVEAKGFAYVLILLGIEAVVRGKWNRAWLCLGGASCFHVIVGGWSTLAAGLAWLAAGRDRPSIRVMLPGLFGGLLLALPALWFALKLTHGVDPETVVQANSIYVWQRLSHHLAADRFKEGFPSRHLMLWGIWLLLVTVAPADSRQWRFRWFVSAAILFTLIGYGLVWIANWMPDTAAALMRLYWFRMSDVFIPLGVALVGLRFMDQLSPSRPDARRLWLAGLIAVAGYDLWMQVAHLPLNVVDSNLAVVVPRADKNLIYDDWLQTCRWIKQHTAADDRFLTPRMSYTLRWYADRAEIVNWKDLPQDSAGIVEWWNRMLDVHTLAKENPPKWLESLSLQGPAKLNELAKKYHAQYAIVQLAPEIPRLATKPEFESPNHSYAVYRLPIEMK